MKIKRHIRRTLWIVAAPFILCLCLCLSVYLPPVQHFLIARATAYASESLGLRIAIGRISLSFPLDLVLEEVGAVSANRDTLLQVSRLHADVRLMPLLRKHIEIDGVTLNDGYIDSSDRIDGLRLKGTVGRIYVSSHGIALDKEEVLLDKVSLENSDLCLWLNDTAAEKEAASSAIAWRVRVEEANVEKVSVKILMPRDSLTLAACLAEACIRDGEIDLKRSTYGIGSFSVGNSSAWLRRSGDTLSQVSLSGIDIRLDSLFYRGRRMKAVVDGLAFKERSGLEIVSTRGRLEADEEGIRIPSLRVSTSDSYVELRGSMDWKALDGDETARVSARLMADIGKPDMLLGWGGVDRRLLQAYPSQPLRIRLGADGTMNRLHVAAFTAELPSAFRIVAEGTFANLTDSIRRSGELSLNSKFRDMRFISLLPGGYTVPEGSGLVGIVSLSGTEVGADLSLTTAGAKVTAPPDSVVPADSLSISEAVKRAHAVFRYDWRKAKYKLEAEFDKLNVHTFLPIDSSFTVSARLQAEGQGTDFFSPAAHFSAKASVDELRYGSYAFSAIRLTAGLDRHRLHVAATATGLVDLKAELNGHLKPNDVAAKLEMEAAKIDWQALQFVEVPLTTAHRIGATFRTDGKKRYAFDVSVLGTVITSQTKTYPAKDLYGGFSSSADYTQAYVRAGDLDLSMLAQGDAETLAETGNNLWAEIDRQWKSKRIRQSDWNRFYPSMYLKITSGRENPIQNYLRIKGISYRSLALNLNTSPTDGVKGDGYIRGLKVDSLLLDSVFVNLRQDSTGIYLTNEYANGAKKTQDAFDISLKGSLSNNSGQLSVRYRNGKKETGAYLGVSAELQGEGIRLHLYPDKPTLVYRPFTLNPDNYVFFSGEGRIDANVNMHDDRGTGVQFYSDRADTLAQQDMTVELNRVDLQEFRRIIPYMPNMEGWIEGSGHYIVKDHKPMINVDLQVKHFVYEGSKLGNWEANAVYLPGSSNDHHVDGFLLHEGEEIGHINGIYLNAKTGSGSLTAEVDLERFPLYVVNPFVPDNVIEFDGRLDGTLSARGNPLNPVLNGQLSLDSVSMYLPDLSARFGFDRHPLQVTDSKLALKDFRLYTKGKAPLTVNGTIDMTRLTQMELNLWMKADNYELLNAPKTKRAVTYGKIYVDVNAFLRGSMDNLVMRGNMNVLGNTDFSYVMKDSPLTVNDRLGETVAFVNFNDTAGTEATVQPTALTGVDVLMTIHVDQAVQTHVDLTEDGSNYMLLEGGGDLSFQYTPEGDMLLNGRYSLISGEMKYEIPVIPLKTFHIQNGSYLEWTGDLMNPKMNIVATERVRARVGVDGQSDRMVSFDVGVKLSQTLGNLGLSFILSAPEDGTIRNELSTMSEEQRNKLAVTMLVTGAYMAESNTSSSGFNVNNALNSFLQNQISDIVGKSLDVNIGVETLEDDRGRHTDYNFQLARRFWNNRVRVVIGGTASTGNTASQRESFIDKVSIEYRLDNSGTRYIKLFHDRNYESVLEGEVVETGAGLVLRKKLDRLGELFIFKKKRDN